MIKHKDPDMRNPWDKFPPGSASKDRYPEGFDPKKCKAITNANIFMWDLYWCLEKEKDLDVFINVWWNNIYLKDFPEEGGCLLELVEKIFNRLIDIGHEEEGIEPEEKDYNLPLDSILRQLSTFQNKHISKTFLEEDDIMAKVAKKETAKAPAKKVPAKKAAVGKVPAKAAEKKPVKKAPVKEPKATDSDVPAWITSGKPGTKAYDSKVLVCDLLMKRKHTDAEICLMVDSELDYKINETRVNFYRYTLNKGRFAPLGFDAPNPPVEQVGGEGTSTPARKSTGKKAAKEEAPAPAKKPIIKKKLILKKKK